MNYKEEMVLAERKLDEAITRWNAAQRSKDFEAMLAADKDCAEAKDMYLTASRYAFYDICFAAEDPLYEALKLHQYQGIRFVDKKVKDTDRIEREKGYSDIFVRLDALNKFANENAHVALGVDPNWPLYVERFNQLMTFYAANELHIDPKAISDSYRISELARQVEMGKTPTSKTQIQKQLQQIVTAMLGEGNNERKFNATSHDAAYVMMTFAKASRRALTVKAQSPRDMYAAIAQICHRIILDANYKLEYYGKKN